MMQFLLANPKWGVQILGLSVIVHLDRRFALEEFSEAIDFAKSFLDLFPDYLKRQPETTQEAT
jgi:hypothetical protein